MSSEYISRKVLDKYMDRYQIKLNRLEADFTRQMRALSKRLATHEVLSEIHRQ